MGPLSGRTTSDIGMGPGWLRHRTPWIRPLARWSRVPLPPGGSLRQPSSAGGRSHVRPAITHHVRQCAKVLFLDRLQQTRHIGLGVRASRESQVARPGPSAASAIITCSGPSLPCSLIAASSSRGIYDEAKYHRMQNRFGVRSPGRGWTIVFYLPTQIPVAEPLKHDICHESGGDVDDILIAAAEVMVKRV
jgi:hypothetical protein